MLYVFLSVFYGLKKTFLSIDKIQDCFHYIEFFMGFQRKTSRKPAFEIAPSAPSKTFKVHLLPYFFITKHRQLKRASL